MKIAIYHNLPFGGAQRALREYIRHLSQNHVIDLYQIGNDIDKCSDEGRLIRRIVNFKFSPLFGSVFTQPYTQSPALLLDLPRLLFLSRKIANLINVEKYDLVFIHGDKLIQNPLVLKYIMAPKLYYCQEPLRFLYEPIFDVDYPVSLIKKLALMLLTPFHYLLKAVNRIGINAADVILANSYYSREYIYKAYHRWSFVSYLGVDLKTYKKLDIPKENIVVSTGLLNWKKKHDLAIRAIAAVPAPLRPRLVIISPIPGNKNLKRELETLAKKLQVNLEIIIGISDDNLTTYFNKAIVVVCCSIMEPFGLVPLEAMACGTPIIAINEGGYRETVRDGITGFLTERDPNEIGRRIAWLIENPEESRKMGEASIKYVNSDWSWEKRFDQFSELMRNFIQTYNKAI